MSKWEKVKLSEVATVVAGSTPKTSVSEYWNGEYNWVTPAELNDTTFVVNDTERKITKKAIKDTSLKPLPIGTVLLSSRAPIGKVAIAGVEMYCNQGFKNLVCLDKVHNKYLFWFLRGKNEFLNSLGRGATFKEISKTIVEKIEIPLPPLETQKHIAKTLDTAAELLAMRKQQLAELDNLIKSTFYDVFGDPVANEKGWEIKTLSELINEGYIIGHLDGNHGSLYPKNSEFVEFGVPYIGANCIDNNKIIFRKAKYLSKERASKFKKGVSKNGDVLFAHNATVGPVAILETQEEYIILSTSLTYYRCNLSLINNYYLMCYMQSPYFVGQYSINMGQTTRNQVPITEQKRFLHMLPPIELQNQFANIVTKIEEQKALVKEAIDETQYLFDSLMSEYFE